jgi:peptide/nickel transport system substrate-binding protein
MPTLTTLRAGAAASAIAAALALVACGSTSKPAGESGASASTATKATASTAPLTVDISTPPASLDPAAVCSIEDLGLLSNLYVTLVKTGTQEKDGVEQEDLSKIEPYLAQSWKATDGGRVYTFKLNPDAKFPSGAPTDAAAVKFSFERATKIGSCGANFLNASEPAPLVKSITTPDATTVVIKLAHPQANFLRALSNTATAIVDPTVLKQHGATSDAQNQWLASHYAGSGPYALASYASGTSAVYQANPSYFGDDKPLEQRVDINFIPNDATLLLQARNGKADVTLGLTKRSVASLKGDSDLKILSIPAAAWQLISFPTKEAPFDNVKLREALTYAVPYQQLLDKVAYGYGQLYYGPFPPVFPEYEKAKEAPRTYDLAKAKALIAQSGVKTPISYPLYIREGVGEQQQIATTVQSAWKDLGVDVQIKQLSAAAYQNAVGAKKKTYGLIRFDGPSITNAGWLATYDLLSTSPYNMSNYDNPKVDALVTKALQTTDAAKAQQGWSQVTDQWIADSPRIPVYAQNYTPVLKKHITKFVYANSLLWFNRWGR